MQSHLAQRAVHQDLVHQVPRLDVVQFTEICLLCYVLSLEKVVYSINVTRLEGINEQAKCYLVLYDIADHELYTAALLYLLLDLPIEALESALGLRNFLFDPRGEVHPVDERLRVIVILL